MKELPKPVTILFLVLGFVLISMVIVKIYTSDNSGAEKQKQYLDQIEIETGNPQQAGKNITP